MRLVPSTCVTIPVVGLSLILVMLMRAVADPTPTLALVSSAFLTDGAIPQRYTCSGPNVSPELKWTGVPASARSLALIMLDPDAPMGTFVHWVIYNLSPTTSALPEQVSPSASLGDGEQGVNGLGSIVYTGPCPPAGEPHHYHFRLYALDERLNLQKGATAQQLESAIQGHILASTELVGIFQR